LRAAEFRVRPTRREDFAAIIALCRRIYPDSTPWKRAQLASHLAVFPQGQFVADDPETGRVVGSASSLIVFWDDYDTAASWRDFTDHGTFRNHDPARGRTLYGADVMVDAAWRGRGIASRIYERRRELAVELGLARIRAGARLRGYHRYAAAMSADAYVRKVITGELHDPTLSFQLRRGFHVLAVVDRYLRYDNESLGYAAVIEWLNEKAARPEDYEHRERWRRRQLPGPGA
jgi:GNAT superfamily N-acetyltransferase